MAGRQGTAGTTVEPAAPSIRDRVVEAAVEVTTTEGWAKVTMARLATAVGFSRQTVYNEVGSKPQLAEAMVLAELARFLAAVEDAFDAHPDDLPGAIEQACLGVLEVGSDNALLRAIVSATHGADTELLPLLTTHAGSLLASAKGVVAGRVAAYDVGVPPEQLTMLVDMVVRTVLSHVMQPSGTPEQTAADLAWVAHRVLRP